MLLCHIFNVGVQTEKGRVIYEYSWFVLILCFKYEVLLILAFGFSSPSFAYLFCDLRKL